MRKEDRAGPRVPNDSIHDHAWARPFPIERIDVPKNDAVAKLGVNPLFLARGDGAVRRPQKDRRMPNGGANGVVGFLDFTPDGGVRHLAQIWVAPTVIRDFVALFDRALQDAGIALGILADDEKGRVKMVSGQDIEQLRREFVVRAVVEGHGDERTFDMNGAVSDRRRKRRR